MQNIEIFHFTRKTKKSKIYYCKLQQFASRETLTTQEDCVLLKCSRQHEAKSSLNSEIFQK